MSGCKTANRLDHEEYTPVLVAHGGNCLNFLMLVHEANKIPLLKRKFLNLDLRYDIFNVTVELKRKVKLDVKELSMKNVYKAIFHSSYECHRALADAQARCKIFIEVRCLTEVYPAKRR